MTIMAGTVPIHEEDKERLIRLQARVKLATGEEPSLQELLHRLIALAEENPALIRAGEQPRADAEGGQEKGPRREYRDRGSDDPG